MNKPVHNTLAAERRKARHYGMQALYQWYMAGASLSVIEAEFRADYDFSHVDLEYFQALLHGVPACVDELDATFEPLLDRKLDDLDPIERTLLRMGTFELRERIDIEATMALAMEREDMGADVRALARRLLDHAPD